VFTFARILFADYSGRVLQVTSINPKFCSGWYYWHYWQEALKHILQ